MLNGRVKIGQSLNISGLEPRKPESSIIKSAQIGQTTILQFKTEKVVDETSKSLKFTKYPCIIHREP